MLKSCQIQFPSDCPKRTDVKAYVRFRVQDSFYHACWMTDFFLRFEFAT